MVTSVLQLQTSCSLQSLQPTGRRDKWRFYGDCESRTYVPSSCRFGASPNLIFRPVECALEVCSLLRTFKSCKEPLDVDFEPPQLVHSSCPEKYLLIVNVRAVRRYVLLTHTLMLSIMMRTSPYWTSPSRYHPFRAIYTFKVSYIQQTYRWEQEGRSFGPIHINMHTLAFHGESVSPPTRNSC